MFFRSGAGLVFVGFPDLLGVADFRMAEDDAELFAAVCLPLDLLDIEPLLHLLLRRSLIFNVKEASKMRSLELPAPAGLR